MKKPVPETISLESPPGLLMAEPVILEESSEEEEQMDLAGAQASRMAEEQEEMDELLEAV